jgi:gliding motility-associatede transport system auxiliary component
VNLARGYAGWLGVLCVVAAGAIALFVPWLTRLKYALLIAGGVLIVIALALEGGRLRSLAGRRAARYGAGATVMIVLALGVVVFANALSMRHSARWDLTENRRNTLSPQTVQLLRTLKAPVQAIAFFRSDTPGKRTAEDLLNQYASHSVGKFTWRLEDTDKAPALAREYGVESYGTVVLKSGPEVQPTVEKVLDAEEEKLTNALVKVTRSGKRIVYVLKGHGEREIGNTDRNGFSQAKEQMEKANYEVKELVLAREPKVPDDAALLIFPGPRTDFFPPELQALDAYLARGGKAFFMATPFQGEALAKYIQKYGITLDDDVVIEVNPIAQVFGVGPLVPIVSQYESHPITKDLGGVAVLFPLTRSMEAAKTPPAGVNVTPLARTSSQSWGETDKSVFQHGEAKPDPGEKTGPLPVAMVATLDEQAQASPQSKSAGSTATEDKKPAKSRIVVVGTADFAANQFLGAQGNRDFFLNVVSWLAEQEDQISIRPKDTRQNPVVLTAAQSNLVLWLPLFVLPGAVLLCGIAVVIHRRRLN